MVGLPESEIPNFIESLPPALRVLRRSIDDLLEYFWDERFRNRACEQAFALSQAAKLQGMIRIFALSRALASVCFISQEEAVPIRHEVASKLRELMALLDDAAAGESFGEQAG